MRKPPPDFRPLDPRIEAGLFPPPKVAAVADLQENRAQRRGPPRPPRDYQAEADEWVRTHPKAYALFVRFIKERAARGHRFGMKAVAERVRWEYPEPGGDYFINNSLVAYIGRRIVAEHPEVADFVEFREARDEKDRRAD